MKTFSILIVVLLSLLFVQPANAEVNSPNQESVPPVERVGSAGNLIKAINYNGVYIPVVDLPLVEIVSTKPGSHILGTVIKNGNYLVEINLPEIEITATQTGERKVRAIMRNGETLVISDLPMIEINSDFPYNHMLTVSDNEVTMLPVVNLPEVMISAITQNNILIAVKMEDGILIPYVELPVINIRPEFTFMSKPETHEIALANKDLEWIYISLKNCGITPDNKIICEISTEITYGDIAIPANKRFVD